MIKRIILFLFFVTFQLYLFSENTDTGVKDPVTPDVKSDDTKSKDPKYNINIKYLKQNKKTAEGIVKGLKGFYIKGLTWQNNEGANQDILIDFVKSIKIIGYTMAKRTKDNFSVVYYIPYIFDIELNDGTKIQNAKGRIKELDSFDVYNAIGKEKCYTYFIRAWAEDTKMFFDNNSKNYEENPKIPQAVVINLEFKENQ